LLLEAGRQHAFRHRRGAFVETHQHLDLGAERLLVEVEGFLAAPAEEQVWLDLDAHRLLRCRVGPLRKANYELKLAQDASTGDLRCTRPRRSRAPSCAPSPAPPCCARPPPSPPTSWRRCARNWPGST